MKEVKTLSIVLMNERDYGYITSKTNDSNANLLYTYKTFNQLEDLHKSLLGEDGCGYTERTVAIVNGLLFELPEDWKEIYEEIKDETHKKSVNLEK